MDIWVDREWWSKMGIKYNQIELNAKAMKEDIFNTERFMEINVWLHVLSLHLNFLVFFVQGVRDGRKEHWGKKDLHWNEI